MEGETSNFFKEWLSVIFCQCFCNATGKLVPKGCIRLLCLFPIVCLFLYLPLYISSIHLVAITSFFIAWLANFKLLDFAFGKGPLSSEPSMSLGHFVVIACLPIKIHKTLSPNQSGKPRKTQNGTKSSPPKSHINGQRKGNPFHQKSSTISHLNYATEGLFWESCRIELGLIVERLRSMLH